MGVQFTEEQQAVIDARECNTLVSAAAGSGKTAVLVERIIQMVSSGIDIDHLLVVTFTKAAASQMKEKITLAIQDRLLLDPSNKHLQKQETLIHNAQITTIDSFCQYVLRNNFNAIGLDPSFSVGDDGELRLIQEEVMQSLLEDEYEKAKSEGNDDFLYCMDYFGTGSSDKKVEEYITQLYRFSMSMPWPEDWITERAGDYDIDERTFDELDFVKAAVESVKRTLKEAADKLSAAGKLCLEPDGPYMYGDLLETEKDSILAALQYNTYNELFDRVRTISFGRLPGKKDDSVNPDKKEYAQKLRNEAKESIKDLFDTYLALPSDTIVSQMKLCDRAVKELCMLTLQYKKRFDEKKREKQLIDFSDMEHFALQILVDHPGDTPSKVALEYRSFYREVLIDEYQDSNNVQELILKSVSGDKVNPSERFMVGDVKQSIYKFRLARPEIFMDKLESYSREKGAENLRIDLHKNFRSRREVLEGTNYIFKRIMGADLGGVDYDEDALLVCGASYDQEAFDMTPELLLVDGTDTGMASILDEYDSKEKEALLIAGRIHELLRQDKSLKFKDIVILLRSNAGWDTVFKDILETQGIPAYIESKSGYFDAWEISVILNFLAIIDNPLQDIPLVSVLHSCIGGLSDEELAKVRIAIDSEDELRDSDTLYEGITGLLEKKGDDFPKLKKFASLLDELRDKSVYTPVHELLQYIVEKTLFLDIVAAMPAGSQRKANVELLLSKAASFEKSSFKGLFHFIRYIEHLKVVQVDYGEAGIIDENADVVRIMSIHKSKGLEFPVVFVAGLSKQFNRRDTKGDIITDLDLGVGVKCIDTNLRVKYDTLKRLVIANKMNTDSLGEELRVLYVALTRAKEKLIMTAYVKKLFDEITKLVRKLPEISTSGELLPYGIRVSSGSYLDLILPAIIRHPGMKDLFRSLEIPEDLYSSYQDKGEVPKLLVRAYRNEDIQAMLAEGTLRSAIRQVNLDTETDHGYDKELLSRLKEKFEAKYAHEELKGLFTKTTVTELKHHVLEEMGETFTRVKFEDPDREGVLDIISEIRQGTGTLSGAERGTAYHRVMEILDDDIYGSEELCKLSRDEIADVVRKWMDQKAVKGTIPESYPISIKAADIATFLLTGLGKRMGSAFRRGELMREKPFMMGISAYELNEKFPEDEMVLIQGIIDAFFIEDGDIILMDYKTDKVKTEKELVDRYKIQLEYYKRALEKSTKKRVKEVFIYSFALGKEIKLEI